MQWRMKYGPYIEKGRGKMDSNLPGKPTTTSSFFLDSIPKRHHCLERELCPLFGGDMSTQLKMTGLPVSQILFEVFLKLMVLQVILSSTKTSGLEPAGWNCGRPEMQQC
jgi:hypothetical protein